MWVNKTTALSGDASADLATIVKGVEITLTNKSDSTKWQTYSVSANPIDNTGYVDFPVVWLRGAAAIPVQRTLMTTAQAALVNVTGQSLTAAVGAAAVQAVRRVAVNVTGQPLTAALGTATVQLPHPISVDVTGEAVTAAIGTNTVKTTQHAEVFVTSPMLCMKVQTNDLTDIKGQAISFDYAYPFEGQNLSSPGMTIRQYYASQAMMGFIAAAPPAANLVGALANFSFQVADSMINYEKAEKAGFKHPMAGSKPRRVV